MEIIDGEDDEKKEEEVPADPKAVAAAERRFKETEQYVDFLFRQLASATYRFNEYFDTRLREFTAAFLAAEAFKTDALVAAAAKKKKKKGVAKPIEFKISSFKLLNDCAQMLLEADRVEEAAELFAFLNHFGRMRGLVLIAGNLLKYLKKAYPDDAEQLSNVEYYYNYWNGFTLRLYSYDQLMLPKNLLPPNLSDATIGCIKWPLAVRTSLYCGVQFIKTTSDLTKVQLLNNNWTELQKFIVPEEFVCMVNIDEYFYKRNARRASMVVKNNMFQMMGVATRISVPIPIGTLPVIEEQLVKYTQPITFDTILLKFPPEIPSEPKKQAKGKKKK